MDYQTLSVIRCHFFVAGAGPFPSTRSMKARSTRNTPGSNNHHVTLLKLETARSKETHRGLCTAFSTFEVRSQPAQLTIDTARALTEHSLAAVLLMPNGTPSLLGAAHQ